MSRPLRLEFEGAVYHITSRGDQREDIFDDNDDRLMWLEVLAEALGMFDATVFAWCLMGNHYHIVLRTRRANLSRLMRHLNGVLRSVTTSAAARWGICTSGGSRGFWCRRMRICGRCAAMWI